MLRLFIFDYDGLLVDSEELALQAETVMLQKLGIQLSPEDFGKYLGYSVRDVMVAYRESYGLTPTADELVAMRQAEMDVLYPTLRLMPGASELIAFLREAGVRLAIASSGTHHHISKGIEKFGLEDSFATVVSVQDVKQGKPHPDLVLEVLHRLQCEPADAMMADDAPSGIACANAAGVCSLAVPPSMQSWDAYADARAVFHDLHEVKTFLEADGYVQ